MTLIQNKQPIIFCDFDGTITLSDNIVAVMKYFDPPGWEEIVRELVSGQKSLRVGVGEMFALLPSSKKKEIQAYVLETAGIRAGFAELLELCKKLEIPFLVTSGGIDFFISPLLEPYQISPDHIYCNTSDFNGTYIKVLWPHPCDDFCHKDCGMCKTRVIRGYPQDRYYRILIGDSITDFEGSKIADFVYARSHLLDRCLEMNILHQPYETFFDVITHLQQLIRTSHSDNQKEGKL